MEREQVRRHTVGSREVGVVRGDLTREEVDAIVNAANSQLLHGGGLAGAIVRRGGHVIQEESLAVAPVAVGHTAVTGAGQLPCRWVIHAVGPRWGEGDEERKLRSAVRSSLDRAAELEAQSVALPAISTGIFGYPLAEGTRVIADEVVAWLRSCDTRVVVGRVLLVAIDEQTVGALADGLDAAI